MLRSTIVLIAIIAHPATLLAEDLYRIRVSIFGYENRLDFGIEPDDEELHVIETIARPGVPFFAKVETGRMELKADRTILTVQGRLDEGDDGEFRLKLETAKEVDTGRRIPIQQGQVQAVLDETRTSTQSVLSLDKPLLIGGTESRSDSRRRVWLTKSGQESAGPVSGGTRAEIVESRISKNHHIVLVTKYQAEQK